MAKSNKQPCNKTDKEKKPARKETNIKHRRKTNMLVKQEEFDSVQKFQKTSGWETW